MTLMVADIPCDELLLVNVLLLCTNCRQPIKARINTPNWLQVEWIGAEGECLQCYQEAKGAGDDRRRSNGA